MIAFRKIYLDRKEVAEILSISDSTVEALTRDPDSKFPKPRQLSKARVGWLLREIEEWSEMRPVSQLPPPPNTGAKKPRGVAKKRGNPPQTFAQNAQRS